MKYTHSPNVAPKRKQNYTLKEIMNEQVAQRAVLFVCEGLIFVKCADKRRTKLIAPPPTTKSPLNSCVLIECDETKQNKKK